VGKGSPYGDKPERWVSVSLNLNLPDKPPKIDGSDGAWGRALAVLWQHQALKEVALLTDKEWLEHEACNHCGCSHIDLGLEVLH